MSHYCEDCRGDVSTSGSPCYEGCEDCPCESESEPELVASSDAACNHQGLPNDMPPCHCEKCDCDCHADNEPDVPDFDRDDNNFDWDSYMGPV